MGKSAVLDRHTLTADADLGADLFEMTELIEFLEDPIAYGQFDWTDPITLDEFRTTRPFRGLFVAPLAF